MKDVHLTKYTIDDMPNEDLAYVAREAGLEVAIALIRHCPGTRILIPKNHWKKYVRNQVKKWYNGSNAKELHRELKVSMNFIWRILNERAKKPVQQSLFQDLPPTKIV